MEPNVRYWIDLASYDFETAKAMLQTQRFLYVGFMCHQTCEKSLKALWEHKKKTMPPRTHNLRLLARELGVWDEMGSDHQELLLTLEPLNVQARYPEDRQLIEQTLTITVCTQLLENTKEWIKWIKNKL